MNETQENLSVWIFDHFCRDVNPHIPTSDFSPKFLLYSHTCCTVLEAQMYWGFLCLVGWLVLICWFGFCGFFLKNLCMYIDIHIKPCYLCSDHILTSLTRRTQPLHLAFPYATQTPRTLELILLILDHTQDI